MSDTRRSFFSLIGAGSAAAALDLPEPAKAESLKPGGIYVLSFDQCLSPKSQMALKEALRPFEEETGCRFLIIDKGFAITELGGERLGGSLDTDLLIAENRSEEYIPEIPAGLPFTDNKPISQAVRISVPKGPAAMGSRIYVDGIEEKFVKRLELSIDPHEAVTVHVEKFLSTLEFNGTAEVRRVTICPGCKQRLNDNRYPVCDVADCSPVGAHTTECLPVAPSPLSIATDLLKRQPEGSAEVAKWFDDRNRFLAEYAVVTGTGVGSW